MNKFSKQSDLLSYQRKHKGISLPILAKRLKVKPQFICNIERKAAGIPPKYIKKLAKELRLPPHVFVEFMVLDYRDFLYSFVKGGKNGRSKTNQK